MQINRIDNYMYLKNIESNIIDEAFIVLKDNIKLKESNSSNLIDEICVLKEAEAIINNNIDNNDISVLKFNLKRFRHKYKLVKTINMILVILIVIIKFIN